MSVRAFDVAVIGGGPAGAMVAWHVARAGYSVAVIEEHGCVGEPVQCAGLVSPRCLDVAGVKAEVLERLSGADFHSPSGKVLGIMSGREKAIVIDRAGLDRAIMDKAADAGASLISGTRVGRIPRGERWSLATGNGSVEAKLLIGADGPPSLTRRTLGLGEPDFMLTGFQADVSGIELPPGKALIFTGREVAPNFFAWAIPAGDVARVGLCVRGCPGTAYSYFKKLFSEGASAKVLKGGKVRKTYAGRIPLGTVKRTYADGAMLVGDAAGQVKATSGGGLYTGLVCAGLCGRSAVDALERGDLSARSLQAYQSAWQAELGDELSKALMMHRVYSGLDDAQLDDIFGMLGREDILEIVNSSGDIDYPSRLAWLLLRKEPGLLKYAGAFLKHGIFRL